MADEIALVRGNNRPYILLTLRDDVTGAALDISDPSVVVTILFRSVTSETVLHTLNTTKLDGGTTGKVRFNFPGNTLDVPAGYYEGEVKIAFGSDIQRLDERLKFRVREAF